MATLRPKPFALWSTLLAALLTPIPSPTGSLSAATEPQKTEPARETAAADSPQESISTEQINKLIERLGDKDYYIRQKAQDDLARLGFQAFEELSAATTNDDLEIAARARYLLRLMRVEWTAKTDPPEVKKQLRGYESLNAEGRQSRMRALATLSQGRGVGALCRLVRFEQSLLLSKLAAVELLQGQVTLDPPSPAVVQTVQNILAASKRPSAAWLLTWTRLAGDRDAAVKDWGRLVDAEQDALRRTPGDSRPELLAVLIRFQIAQLKKLNKIDDIASAVARLTDLERGDSEALVSFGDWLLERKEWKRIDQLAERFPTQFASDPWLIYLQAQAYAEQNQKERAEEFAARALALYPGKQPEELFRHAQTADRLRRRGLFGWAEREFEHVIANGDMNHPSMLQIVVMLSEMLHDQGKDLEAAQTLEKLAKTFAERKKTPAGQEFELPGRLDIIPRMHYFYAVHWQKQNDMAKCREALDRALDVGEDDVDVLITCYRLPNQPPEFHAKIVQLIQKAAATLRTQIEEDPEEDSTYNQFAWLIGNTEGDLDEALKYSHKSLELRPKAGSFCDTLARVYFAKGDLENAVKYQTQAAELEPHSGLIRGQLELFRKALEAKGKKP